MDRQPYPKDWKAWFDKQAQLQEDGTYLIRRRWLWGRPGVYQVDAAAKRRWIRFQIVSLWLGGALGVLLIVLKGDAAWNSARVILSGALVLGAALLLGYGGSFVILRHAPRVPAERWHGPAVVDRWGPISRGRERARMLLWGTLTVVFVLLSIFSARAGSIWERLLIVLLAGTFFVLSLLRYRRAGRGPS